ncbi:MAG: hypothetical protein COS92_00700 [Desulfobacterales bacterium CG07_land_8_20_14_0_80_52_14]|nr:MAG: hypothetical protein COX20_06425 [Desulfobacterales bacterium CG23_combo_of_CG06-09_8_20_14_all_52_9]PIU50563.1 MAG: hypothetical protein COS92_00700 [Desulfobacterales bacterium CG07_land_8_20_14_0_80_52_14]
MNQDTSVGKKSAEGQKTILVALDFSECSNAAYRKACDMLRGSIARIIALHVIDSEFVKRCVANRLGEEDKIKKSLFLNARKNLQQFVEQEKESDFKTDVVVSEGIPYLEIIRKAREFDVDVIIMGSCGRAADIERIFFGTTAEKVLRFITHPVLCIPPDTDYKG